MLETAIGLSNTAGANRIASILYSRRCGQTAIDISCGLVRGPSGRMAAGDPVRCIARRMHRQQSRHSHVLPRISWQFPSAAGEVNNLRQRTALLCAVIIPGWRVSGAMMSCVRVRHHLSHRPLQALQRSERPVAGTLWIGEGYLIQSRRVTHRHQSECNRCDHSGMPRCLAAAETSSCPPTRDIATFHIGRPGCAVVDGPRSSAINIVKSRGKFQ